jgi:hypothetical protein
LIVDPATLDFGEAWECSRFDWPLSVRNTSDEVIEFADVMTSCHCHEASPRQFTLKPGETAVVTLVLDLTARQPSERDLICRAFSSPVYLVLRGRSQLSDPITVTGRVRSRLTTDVREVHFGEEAVSGGQPLVRYVAVRVHVPVVGIRAFAPPGAATVAVQPDVTGEGRYRVAISPSPSLSPGPFKFDVTVDVVDVDGQTLPGVKLTAAGTMSPPAGMLPSQVLFGARTVGTSADAELTLTVPAGEKWVVEQVEVESADLRVDALDRESVGLCYRVRQQVREKGDRSSKVWFVVAREHERDRPLRVEVVISYTGIGPDDAAKSEEGGP